MIEFFVILFIIIPFVFVVSGFFYPIYKIYKAFSKSQKNGQ